MPEQIPCSPEWEQRYQFVQNKYDIARGLGIDVLKFYLQVVIAIIVIPIIFRQQTFDIFGNNIGYIYAAWISVIVAILLGVLAYVMIFEGYYHQAHMEACRHLDHSPKAPDAINKYINKANLFFNIGHWTAIGSFLFFGAGLLSFVLGILLLFWGNNGG